MDLKDDFRRSWLAATLSIAAALFFTAALLYSSLTYVSIMDARKNIVLADAAEEATILPNGSLSVSISIELRNPSWQELHISSVSWAVKVANVTDSGIWWIPVASSHNVPTEHHALVGSHESRLYVYQKVVSDPGVLSALRGYINYSASDGTGHTIETIPYSHDFRIVAWLGDYKHDYLYYKELYLNDLVKIERRYYAGVYI